MKELQYGFRDSWPKIIIDIADILHDCKLGKITIGDFKESNSVNGHASIKLEVSDIKRPKQKLARIQFVWETFTPTFEGDPWAGTWMSVRPSIWAKGDTIFDDYDRPIVIREFKHLHKAHYGLVKYGERNFICDIITEMYQGITGDKIPDSVVDTIASLESAKDITGYCDNLSQRPLFIGSHGGWFTLTRTGKISFSRKPNYAEYSNTPMFELTGANRNICSKVIFDYSGKSLYDAICVLQYVAKNGFPTIVLETPVIENPEQYAKNIRLFEKAVLFPVTCQRFSMETFVVQCQIDQNESRKFERVVKRHPMDLINWIATKLVGVEAVERRSGGSGIYGALFEQVWVNPYGYIEIEFTPFDEL